MTIDGDMALKLMTFAISIGTALYAWVISQGRAYEPKLKELAEHCDGVTREFAARLEREIDRIAKVEGDLVRMAGEMAHLPSKDMVHRIELGMKEMQARIEAQAEVTRAVERTMQRIEAFMLETQNRPVARSRSK